VRPLPFIGKKDFIYNGAKKESVRRKFVEISPGDTVFEVIKRAANSLGYLFWASPDGKFVFDKPLVRGRADYKIHALEDGSEMDYIEGSVEHTINGIHSEVKVVGESQDGDDIKYVMATAKNGAMPFAKPLVVNWNENDGPAKRTAELQVAVEKASSTRLEYTLKGFSQNGKVWQINKFVDVRDDYNGVRDMHHGLRCIVPQINKFVDVRDDYNGVRDAYLVKSVTFTLDRQSGMRTKLELQPGGSL
jgi:prophage tail gpP-like protein